MKLCELPIASGTLRRSTRRRVEADRHGREVAVRTLRDRDQWVSDRQLLGDGLSPIGVPRRTIATE